MKDIIKHYYLTILLIGGIIVNSLATLGILKVLSIEAIAINIIVTVLLLIILSFILMSNTDTSNKLYGVPIDVYIDGIYAYTTAIFHTCEEAKTHYVRWNIKIDPNRVTAKFKL